MVADKQHIDYLVSGLDDADDNARKRYDANDEGELSFDYRKHKQDLNDACSLRNSAEVPLLCIHHSGIILEKSC